jgi:hypothetical protein
MPRKMGKAFPYREGSAGSPLRSRKRNTENLATVQQNAHPDSSFLKTGQRTVE